MSTETILELRQKDPTSTVIFNGDYETSLAEPIILNEGAEVNLKGVFLDTANDQSLTTINVESNDPDDPTRTNCEIDFVYYSFDWGTTDVDANGQPDIYKSKTFFPNKTYPDANHYVLSDTTDAGSGLELQLLESFQIRVTGGISDNFGGLFPDELVCFFKYTDAGGNPQNFTFEMSSSDYPTYFGGFNLDKNQTNPNTIDEVFLTFSKTGSHGSLEKPVTYKSGTCKLPLVIVKDSFQLEDVKTYAKQQKGQPPEHKGVNRSENQTGVAWFQYQGLEFVGVNKTENIPDTNRIFTPRIIRLSFSIPSRSYAPADLAETLTRAITKTHQGKFFDNDPEQGLVDNVLLTTTQNLFKVGTISGAHRTPQSQNSDPFFISSDGLRVMQFNTSADTSNFLIGTSQFVVEYVDSGTTGKFQISQCHYPLFGRDHDNGLTIVKFINEGTQAGESQPVRFVANKNCGIAITNLSPANLWFDQLSFDPSIQLQFETKTNQNVGGGTFAGATTFSFRIEDGIQTTGQLKSVDALVIKDSNFFDVVPSNLNFDVLVPQTIPIPNKTNVNYNKINEGYYLVEITGTCIQGNMVCGDKINKRIFGIVNKFYDLNSFTSAVDGEGSFTYIHKGEPMLINNFRIRILKSDYNLADNLNDNNTVFLNIINPDTTIMNNK